MKTAMIKVEGMHCEKCEAKVKNALTEIDGVSKVEVSLDDKLVSVLHDGRVGMDELVVSAIEAIDDHKFSVVKE